MEGEEDRIESSRVSPRSSGECHVEARRPGLNQGLSSHHRAQVEGVEGPMGNVPQVVARKVVCLRHVPASTPGRQRNSSGREEMERYHGFP